MKVRQENNTTGDRPPQSVYDVIIVGAGLSGIGSAYWLQQKCKGKNFILLEARNALGGTWDLFRYPGIRSDSDMFTFGYRFKPWQDPQSLSDGDSILKYLTETAQQNGIDKKIRYGHKVTGATWLKAEMCWQLTVQTAGETRYMHGRFLYMCSGYFSYDEAHRPTFEGEEKFKGQIVVPQFWPNDLDYSGKRVIVVGSGATAVTLVPTMAQTAKHVTMLQRSPTYIMRLPNRNKFFVLLKKWLPEKTAYRITRWKNLGISMFFFSISQVFPKLVKRLIMNDAVKQLRPGYAVHKHFNPAYNPWDQRLCVIPDGDLFAAIRNGKADVVTDAIARFTEHGIQLTSGEELQADIIVLATGLQIKLLGGAELIVDGKHIQANETMVYKGMMLSDVPNIALAFGYTNASWTLKTDLTANYVCKLLNYMDRKGYVAVTPRRQAGVAPQPFLSFMSGYIQRATHLLPLQGTRRPWRVYQNYFLDMLITRFGKIPDGILQFQPQKQPGESKR